MLRNVAAWLLVNSMKSEELQFQALCEQNVANIPRKTAFRYMLAHHNNSDLETKELQAALDVFAERVDYSIDNFAAAPITFPAPKPGRWSVQLAVTFAGDLGSATYYWEVTVR